MFFNNYLTAITNEGFLKINLDMAMLTFQLN